MQEALRDLTNERKAECLWLRGLIPPDILPRIDKERMCALMEGPPHELESVEECWSDGTLGEYANLNNLVKIEKSCPHEESTQRESIAQLIKEVEKLFGAGPYNLFKSMGNISAEYLPSSG